MANNKIQIKRTSVTGRTANVTSSGNSQFIDAGEFALNMADGILYTSNGSALITVGSNLVNQNITGNLTVNAVIANGSFGTAGQVLSTNSTGVYWSSAGSGSVTSVNTGNGMTGGPITDSGTLSVLANNGIIANSTGVFVDTAYIGTLTANNSNNLGGVVAASYVQNTDSRTLSGNLVFSGANVSFTGLADTATAATHYYVETSSGNILPKTLANAQTEIVTNAAVDAAGAVMNTGDETIAGTKTFSSPILAPAGTALLPAYSTSGDANTGIFFPEADTIGFSTNGTTAAQFTSIGDLRLFNTAGTFYSELSNSPTANRTVTIPDVSGTALIAQAAAAAGYFDTSATTPTASNRLNYGGYIYPTALNLTGQGETVTAATHYFVETGSDGFVRPKTLANAQTEIVTNAAVDAAGAVMNTGNESIAGIKTFSNGTASTNTTSGSVVVTGGLGVSGSVTASNGSFTTLILGGTAITATAAELNKLDGVTATAAELNILDGVTATAAELNKLDGVTTTAAELNFVDGVTSAIQTQLNTKFASTIVRTFISGTTYTPTAGMKYCLVFATGGGGGGGGSDCIDTTAASAGAGGGAGGTAIKYYTAAQIGANAAFAIGAGGTAGSASGSDGGSGGTTTFTPSGGGAALSAAGGTLGNGGGQPSGGVATAAGVGGTPTGGDFNIPGGDGQSGAGHFDASFAIAGSGGNSFWGGGGRGAARTSTTSAGQPGGINTGAGGGGSATVDSTTGSVGGAGGAGVVFIMEFI